MATVALLDYCPAQDEAEKDPEPRVVTRDVSDVLKRVVRPDDEDSGESVSLIAERAETSTRTVYRIISVSTETIKLDMADRLCLAAGSHLDQCRMVWPDETITSYGFLPVLEVL